MAEFGGGSIRVRDGDEVFIFPIHGEVRAQHAMLLQGMGTAQALQEIMLTEISSGPLGCSTCGAHPLPCRKFQRVHSG